MSENLLLLFLFFLLSVAIVFRDLNHVQVWVSVDFLMFILSSCIRMDDWDFEVKNCRSENKLFLFLLSVAIVFKDLNCVQMGRRMV